jgi:hypothetical protein
MGKQHFDHEILFKDEIFEDKPFVTADGKQVYAHAAVFVQFNARDESCDYPDNIRREWTEIKDWRAEIDIGDVSAYDDQGEEVEATEEMRKWFEDQFDLDEGHKEQMLQEAEDDAERDREDSYPADDY